MELFLFELGVRVNKLQNLHRDDSVENKRKIWLDKKNWIKNLTKALRKSIRSVPIDFSFSVCDILLSVEAHMSVFLD